MTDKVKKILDNFSDQTNRSLAQTIFLFELCDHSLFKLAKLEENIKNLCLFYCPGDKEEVEKILAMEINKPLWFTLDQWRVEIDPNNKWTLIFNNRKGNLKHYVAVPPLDNGERIDYIDCSENNKWIYHYNSESTIKPGIKIVVKDGKIHEPVI